MGQTNVTVTDKWSNAPLDNATFAPPAGLPADSVAVTAKALNVYTVQWNDLVNVTGQVYCSDTTDYPAEGRLLANTFDFAKQYSANSSIATQGD
jgi:hypothetical protein